MDVIVEQIYPYLPKSQMEWIQKDKNMTAAQVIAVILLRYKGEIPSGPLNSFHRWY
jgi:hypothetical protein